MILKEGQGCLSILFKVPTFYVVNEVLTFLSGLLCMLSEELIRLEVLKTYE
jgi:hypothetical protein